MIEGIIPIRLIKRYWIISLFLFFVWTFLGLAILLMLLDVPSSIMTAVGPAVWSAVEWLSVIVECGICYFIANIVCGLVLYPNRNPPEWFRTPLSTSRALVAILAVIATVIILPILLSELCIAIVYYFLPYMAKADILLIPGLPLNLLAVIKYIHFSLFVTCTMLLFQRTHIQKYIPYLVALVGGLAVFWNMSFMQSWEVTNVSKLIIASPTASTFDSSNLLYVVAGYMLLFMLLYLFQSGIKYYDLVTHKILVAMIFWFIPMLVVIAAVITRYVSNSIIFNNVLAKLIFVHVILSETYVAVSSVWIQGSGLADNIAGTFVFNGLSAPGYIPVIVGYAVSLVTGLLWWWTAVKCIEHAREASY